MSNAPQQPNEYRAKLRRLNLLSLRTLSTRGITDAERDEMNTLTLELEEMELAADKAQAGSLGGAL